MLTTHDIGNLFQAMRTAYGPQWKFDSTAMPTWREALRDCSPETVQRAANDALAEYPNHPPTLPQFIRLAKPRAARPNTYLPPPNIDGRVAQGNRVLFKVLGKIGGVDRHTLKLLVQLKNGLVEDEETAESMEMQLRELAGKCDVERRQAEADDAREVYARRCGM